MLPGYDDQKRYRHRLHGEAHGDGSGKTSHDPAARKRILARLEERIDLLLRKAIVQAGYSEVLARHALLEWRGVGFWAGTDLARRYGVPAHLRRFPCVHVRLGWRDPEGNPVRIAGPVSLGGGRFFGVGLFAAVREM